MNQITFHAPRLTEIGGGTVAGIAALLARLGLSRPLIVSDPFMVSSGLLERLTQPLRAAGIAVEEFSLHLPSLDEVFFTLTGTRSQDDDEKALV